MSITALAYCLAVTVPTIPSCLISLTLFASEVSCVKLPSFELA